MQRTSLPKADADAYAAAVMLLYSRLWWDLEGIYLALTQWPNTEEPESVEGRIMIFRLEVLLVLEACDSPAWRSMLRPGDCLALQTTMENVLKTLDVPICRIDGELIGSAQNQLFDAVLPHIPAMESYSLGRRQHHSSSRDFLVEAFAHA